MPTPNETPKAARPARRSTAPFVFAGVALLAVAVRVPFMRWPMISDEGGYAYGARWWFDGLTLYGPELWFDRPQGIFLAYALGMALLGGATWAVRLWGALWAAGTALAVVGLTRELSTDGAEDEPESPSSWGVPALAGVLAALLLAQPAIEGFTANAELFALLPATLSAWMLLRGRWGWAGVLASAAFMLKPSGGSIVLLGLGMLVYQRAPVRAWAAYALGAGSLVAAGLAHGVATVGLGEYLYAALGFRIGFEPEGASALGALGDTLEVWFPSLALAVLGLVVAGRTARVFWLLWFASSGVGVAMGANWFWHYFIQIVPPLAVGAALGGRWLWAQGTRLARATALLPAVLALVLLTPWALRPPEDGIVELYNFPAHRFTDDVALAVQQRTEPDELIYVAFAQAAIYHLADRRSALRHLYWLDLLHMPGVYEELLGTVAAGEPSYIYVAAPTPEILDPENRFRRLLEEGYVVDTVFSGRPLYRRR